MDDLSDLYQDIILDHYRHPRHEGELAPCTGKAEGFNPLCGDKVTVYVRKDDGNIEAVRFVGEGCAISQASASIMASQVEGLSEAGFAEKFGEVKRLLTAEEEPEADLEVLGDIAALVGVRKFPARIKCATLAWHTLAEALGSGRDETANGGEDGGTAKDAKDAKG